MLRFVVGPDGAVVPDIRGRLPGRGAWVTCAMPVVETAARRKAFARAFRREVAVDSALAAQVEALLAKDALQALAFANKAGLVVAGTFKVEAALTGGAVVGLLHARGASADGMRKLAAAARRGGAMPPTLQIFESGQLDLALGRANVIHAALLAGGAADAFLERATRLHTYRTPGQPPGTDETPGSQPDPS